MPYDNDQMFRIYRSKYISLSNVRANMVPTWTDIRNFLAPRTARFPGENVNDGRRQDLNIINSSPRLALRTLAAGMQSGVTNPMRPWFRLGTPDPQLQDFAPVKLWLYEVERLMRDMFARSNLYDRLKSNYSILGAYGTSCLGIEDDDDDILRAVDMPMGSFSLYNTSANRCTTMYRDLTMGPEQMIEKFCKGDMKMAAKILPTSIINAYDNGNYDFPYPLVNIIEPNRNYVEGSALSNKKKYASVWADFGQGFGAGTLANLSQIQGGGILSYKGYDDLPFMAPRWEVLGEDVWGFGCGEVAIGDSKQVQLMEKRKLQGIDKNVNPPKLADASMRNQRISSMPNDTTYVNGLIQGRPGVIPMYQPNPYINEMRDEIQSVNNRIDEAFYKNLFMMVSEIADQPNITATQINTMREEKLLMLGPVLERLNDELLNPLIERAFNMMYRRGMLPPPPKEIQGQPLRVEYISVLAQAQKAIGLGNIERYVGFVGNLAQLQGAAGQPPSAIDKINIDALIDEYGDGIAIPPTINNTDDQVAAIRQGRNQQAQMQQGMAMAQQGSEAAQTLSNTNLQGDNALTRALQLAGAPG
jgi:hypothetical protein